MKFMAVNGRAIPHAPEEPAIVAVNSDRSFGPMRGEDQRPLEHLIAVGGCARESSPTDTLSGLFCRVT